MKKLIKKLNVRLFIVVAAFAFCTLNVNAWPNHHHHHHHYDFSSFTKGNNCKTVGAPLDSGLLTVLLGAGALFFVTRKKQEEE